MNEQIPEKKCTKCGRSFPLIRDYWFCKSRSKDGFWSSCKECNGGKFGIHWQRIERREGERRCSKCHQWFPATLEYFRAVKSCTDGLNGECVSCDREYHYHHYHSDPDKQRERKRREYRQDPTRHKERDKLYRTRNIDKIMARNRRWLAQNPGKAHEYYRRHYTKDVVLTLRRLRVKAHVRAARKRSLPDDFTLTDWEYALSYFHGCCAVCGRPLNDLFRTHTAAADHWIPLTSPRCPGTVPTNIIPLCHGKGGCNNSKNNNDPCDWLVRKFGGRKAAEVLTQIEAFFQTVRR